MILRSQHHCGGEPGIKAQYPPPQILPAAWVKTANPEYMDTQQDLTSGIKRFRHQGYAGFKGGFQAFLSNYCLLSIWVLMVQLLAQV